MDITCWNACRADKYSSQRCNAVSSRDGHKKKTYTDKNNVERIAVENLQQTFNCWTRNSITAEEQEANCGGHHVVNTLVKQPSFSSKTAAGSSVYTTPKPR